MGEFDGKTILITGGGSGIGLATAARLVREGANVVLAGRRADRVETAAKELDPAGGRAIGVVADVSRTDSLDNLIAAVRTRYGRLDGVFANAGVPFSSPSELVSEKDFDRVLDINLKGVFFTIQKSVPLFDRGGFVVINGSVMAHRGLGLASVYAAAKAAATNLTRTLASDLADKSIRVNAVSPGFTRTEMLDEVAPTEQAREAIRAQIPLGEFGEPEQVADVVTFLLSSRAGYVTGQDLGVDGGLANSVPMSAGSR
ncbi:short-chain alcohol dehydrogenase like protein [Saccharomonospora marina XMU15]|uniref:Short-chain alcohol dehydrogenase like protein n=1 Tax=Saccharomonospora marina XMU15 TaxID=882083 RepID=H5WWV5_9PSEU|nr:glucose 1-dehydrogenase [Saccharomonospora marina]EHR52783.1 short-chain alcohol dehydrogenase like protein [Saccharomonospora marina XMU15]